MCTNSKGTKSGAKWWGWVECGGDPLGRGGCVGWGWLGWWGFRAVILERRN